MKKTDDMDRRYLQTEFEVRSADDGTGGTQFTVSGYASKFGKRSMPMGNFVEEFRQGAFARHLSSNPDVRSFFNHNEEKILGRTRSGTLRLAEDTEGLYYEVDLPDTSYARDLAVSMERGDISKSSFGFLQAKADWSVLDDGMALRSVYEAVVFEVSPVIDPAYDDSTSSVSRRCLEELAGLETAFSEESINPAEVADDQTVRSFPKLDLYQRKLAVMRKKML